MSFAPWPLPGLPFGQLAGVSLPPARSASMPAGLHPDEATYAGALPLPRRTTWIGGRLALRAALAALGVDAPGPLLATARGAPALPGGVVGSVSHKDDIAVALAARVPEGRGVTLGVDVETPRRLRQDISRHVLTPGEQQALAGLEGAARDAQILRVFAAKEAIYKALDPWVGRFVSFQEAAVARGANGEMLARLDLARGEGPFSVELVDASNDQLILVAARISCR